MVTMLSPLQIYTSFSSPPDFLPPPPKPPSAIFLQEKCEKREKRMEREQSQGRPMEETSFLAACCSEWVIEVAVI